jgi:hypothetical protein
MLITKINTITNKLYSSHSKLTGPETWELGWVIIAPGIGSSSSSAWHNMLHQM